MPETSVRASWTRYVPFSGVLLARLAKDYWTITGLAVALAVSFHWLFVTFIPMYNLRYKLTYVKRMPAIVRAMIGEDILEISSTTALGSFAYFHPVSLSLLLAFAIWLPTGAIVGQIDRGTIDLVLATPLSRRRFMATTILAGCLGGAVVIAGMLAGTWIGVQRTAMRLPETYEFGRIVLVALNLYAVYLVALAWSTFFAAASTFRGYAVGWAFALSLASYMLHFLSEWWDFVREHLSQYGPLYYFRAIKVAAGNYDPTNDILGLSAVALGIFLVATLWFSRRDIAVV
jgi:ABC-2 type transport system permease protein